MYIHIGSHFYIFSLFSLTHSLTRSHTHSSSFYTRKSILLSERGFISTYKDSSVFLFLSHFITDTQLAANCTLCSAHTLYNYYYILKT